jgi:hypothetical protein
VNEAAKLDTLCDAAAEEVLRVIYGDDLQGCTVTLDEVAGVIRAAFQEHICHSSDLAELHAKGFEAVHLLATPPADGNALSPEDLRSLLSERLDSIRNLAAKVLSATSGGTPAVDAELRDE